jgi:hypothetical protein
MAGAEGAFQATIAHGFIVGSAVFGIFWGVVNALLIKSVKFDVAVIDKAIANENKSE